MSEPEDHPDAGADVPHGHTPPEAPPPPAGPVPTTKVRILHGNQTGQIQDLPRVEAEVAIQTGYAEAVVDEPVHDDPAGTRRAVSGDVATRLGGNAKPETVAERMGAAPSVKKAPESP